MNSTGEIVVDNFAGGGGASTGIEISLLFLRHPAENQQGKHSGISRMEGI